MARILALDISTRTGFCVDGPEPGSKPVFGLVQLPAAKFEGDYGRRLHAFHSAIADLVTVHEPTTLVFEAPWVPGMGGKMVTTVHTVRLLISLAGVAELVGAARGLDVIEQEPSSVRKFWLGYARGERKAIKAAVIARCKAMGFWTQDDNVADAIALHQYQRHVMGLDRHDRKDLVLFGEKAAAI